MSGAQRQPGACRTSPGRPPRRPRASHDVCCFSGVVFHFCNKRQRRKEHPPFSFFLFFFSFSLQKLNFFISLPCALLRSIPAGQGKSAKQLRKRRKRKMAWQKFRANWQPAAIALVLILAGFLTLALGIARERVEFNAPDGFVFFIIAAICFIPGSSLGRLVLALLCFPSHS